MHMVGMRGSVALFILGVAKGVQGCNKRWEKQWKSGM